MMRPVMRWCVAMLLCFAFCQAAPARAQDMPNLDMSYSHKEPDTVEDRVAVADVVVLGVVERVVPLVESDNSLGRKAHRETLVATVRVETVFKGNADAASMTVQFEYTEAKTRPPLVSLRQGERMILFLKSTGGQHLQFIGSFYGKYWPEAELLEQLKALSKEKGLAAEVTLTLATANAGAAGGVAVRVQLMNKGAVPVLFAATPAPDVVLVVTSPDGARLSMRSGVSDRTPARTTLYLPASGVLSYTADLSRYFEFPAPGAYTVQAVFAPPRGSSGAWSAALASDIVTVQVR